MHIITQDLTFGGPLFFQIRGALIQNASQKIFVELVIILKGLGRQEDQ